MADRFLAFFAGIAILTPTVAFSAILPTPTVTLRVSASVQDEYFTLGEIADITPSPSTNKMSAQLAATVVGRSPLDGATRPLTRGDITLKMRQARLDPRMVDFEGLNQFWFLTLTLHPLLPARPEAPLYLRLLSRSLQSP